MIRKKKFLTLSSVTLLCLASLTPPVQAKSFYQVVETALKTHPDVLRSRATVRAEEEGIKVIRGQYLPTVDLSMGYGKENTDTTTVDDETLNRRESSVVLRQLLFDGKGVSSRYQQQAARYDSARMQLAATEEAVAQRAFEVYLDSVTTREIAKLAKANEQEHIDTLEKVKQLYAGGAGRKGDISLAEGRLAQTRATLERLKNNIKDANASYESVIGEQLSYKIKWPVIPAVYLPKSTDEAVQMALKNNPTLRSTLDDAKTVEYAVADSKSVFWPTLNLEFSASNNEDLDGTKGKNNDSLLMLKGNWNLLNGGSDVATYNQNVQRSAEANENIARTRRQLIEQVTQTWNQLKTSERRLQQLEKHMIASREVLDAYEEQFKFGQRQLFNLLDQKNELFDAKVNYVNGRDEVVRLSYQLLSRIGVLTDYIISQRNKELEKVVQSKKADDKKHKQQQKIEKMEELQKKLENKIEAVKSESV